MQILKRHWLAALGFALLALATVGFIAFVSFSLLPKASPAPMPPIAESVKAPYALIDLDEMGQTVTAYLAVPQDTSDAQDIEQAHALVRAIQAHGKSALLVVCWEVDDQYAIGETYRCYYPRYFEMGFPPDSGRRGG